MLSDSSAVGTLKAEFAPEREVDSNRRQFNLSRVSFLFAWVLIAAAVFLRVACYVHNRSFWTDEAALAVNILDRDYSALTQALDHRQAGPLLFLWAERFAYSLFGPTEPALRSFVLLGGIASIPLLYSFARLCVSKWSALFALALFALSDLLIRYATELKQYGGDVFSTLLIYLCTARYLRSPTWTNAVVLAVSGAVTIWLSFPSLFVIGGVLCVLTFECLKGRFKWNHLICNLSAWSASLVSLYFVQLRNLIAQRSQLEFYGVGAFPPANIDQTGSWLWNQVDLFTAKTLDLHIPLLLGFLFIAGLVALTRKDARISFVLLFPIVPVFILSSLHLYPIVSRYLLFLAPTVYIIMAGGLDFAFGLLIRNSRKSQISRVVATAICTACGIAVLWSPVAVAIKRVNHPLSSEEVRPALQYIQENWQPDDYMYVYGGAANAYRYYRHLSVWDDAHVIVGKAMDKDHFVRDLDQLRGKQRVWILVSHVHLHGVELPMGRYIDAYLGKNSKILDRTRFPFTFITLCDLTEAGGESQNGVNSN